MADHYYSQTPVSDHKPLELAYQYRGAKVTLATDSGVFSRTEIDRGTDALLQALPHPMRGAVLDMGCGYGAIGVTLGKRYPECAVTMADVNQRACGLSKQNALQNGVAAQTLESDGYEQVLGLRFDYIVQNPPIRAGKAVIYRMFADAARCLLPGGSLWLVVRKQQGAPSALVYLQTLYRDAAVVRKQSGYWVLRCQNPYEQNKETN